MSKKPRQKSGSASIGRWDSQLVNFNVNDTEWNAALFFLIGEKLVDFKHIDLLHSTISTGIRKQFYVISKEDVLAQARELGGKVKKGSNRDLPQFVEVCEHVKGILDNGETVTPRLQSRLIKFKIIQLRAKDIARSEADKKVGEQGNRGNLRSDKTDAKTKKPISSRRSRSPGKKKEIQRDVPMPHKRESKLKKRGEKDDNFQTIDDEPEHGPQAYIILHGFSEAAVVAFCAESNIPMNATIKVRSNDYEAFEQLYKLTEVSEPLSDSNIESNEAQKQHDEKLKRFWKELDSVVLQSPPTSKLHDLASFEVEVKKSSFPIDYQNLEQRNEFGLQIFNDLANVCYNMLTRRKEYQEYLKMINMIHIPQITQIETANMAGTQSVTNEQPVIDVDVRYYNDLLNSIPSESVSAPLVMYAILEQVCVTVDENEIAASLSLTTAAFPPVPPPSTAATAITKEESVEVPVIDYFDSALRNLGLTDAAYKAITDTQCENSVWTKDKKKEAAPVVVHHGDYAKKKYYHLTALNNVVPKDAELEMLRKLPLSSLSEFQSPSNRILLERASRSHELQHFCARSSLTNDMINRILKQATFENLTLTSVDENECVKDTKNTKQIILPWDDPYLYPDSHQGENQGSYDYDNWLYAEHHDADTMVQVLNEANHLRPYKDTYYNRRDNTLLVVMHNPISARQQNLVQWNSSLYSNVGFRNYLEFVARDIGDVVSEKVRQQIAASDALNVTETETVAVVIQPAMPVPPKQDLISRASMKEAEIAESLESGKRTKSKRGQRRSPHADHGKISERRSPSPPLGSKKSTSKSKLLANKSDKTTEKDKEIPIQPNSISTKRAATNRRGSIPESVKSVTIDSSIRSDTPTREDIASKELEIERNDYEPEEKFLGYDMGDQMIRVSGCVATQLPCDNGLICSEKTSYIHGTVYVKTSVYKDGNHFVVHVIDPLEEDNEINLENPQDIQTYKATRKETSESQPLSDKTEEENEEEEQVQQLLSPCKFGSFVGHLRDGIIVSYSHFGGHGKKEISDRDDDFEVIPHNEQATQAASSTPSISPTKSRKYMHERQDSRLAHEQQDSKIDQDNIGQNNPKEPYQTLFISCPDGLHIQGCLNDKLNYDDFEGNKKGIIIRQLFTDKSNGFHECEALKARITKEELGRTFTHDGNVIKLMVDGSIHILMANGVMCRSASGSINFPRPTTNVTSGIKAQEITPNTPQKKTGSRNVSKKAANVPVVDQSSKIALEKFNQWEVVSSEGQRYSTRLDTTHSQLVNEIISTVMSDPVTHQMVRVREDNVMISNHKNGSSVVEYPDGTRIRTYYEDKLIGRDEDGNRITEKIKYRKIECCGYASVIFNCNDGSCQVLFATGTIATIRVDGNHTLKLDDGSQLELNNDGRSLYQPVSVLKAAEMGKNVGVAGVYEMHHASKICCHTVDSRGNTFKVSAQGKVIVDYAQSPESDGDQLINPLILPRLFILKPNGSGAELMNAHLIDSTLTEAAADQETVMINENVSSRSRAACVTILKPLADVSLSRWAVQPREEDSIMSSLKVNSFRVDETIADLKQEMSYALLSDCPGKGYLKNVESREIQTPKGLELRHIIRYPRISKKERKTFFNCLKEYNVFVTGRENNSDQLLPQDYRAHSERQEATRISSNFNKEITNSRYRKEDNEFISDILSHGSKPEMTDADIIQLYIQTRSPSKLDKVQKPKPKRTAADWEADQEELEMAEARKQQLRNHKVPAYFDSEKGREVLTYINEPNMTMLAKELAKSPFKNTRERSSTALSYLEETAINSQNRSEQPVIEDNYTQKRMLQKAEVRDQQQRSLNVDEEARPGVPTPGRAMYNPSPTTINEASHNEYFTENSRPENSTPSKAITYPTTVVKYAEEDNAPMEEVIRTNVQSAPLERVIGAAELETTSPDIPPMRTDSESFTEFGQRNVFSENLFETHRKTSNNRVSQSSQSRVRHPVSVKGSRPGSIPNERYMKIESPVRREVNTASVSNGRQSRAFEVFPDCVDFGVLKEGYTYRSIFLLKNIGVDIGRFKITQPPPSTGIRVTYQPGPLAVGVSARIIVDMFAMAAGVEGGKDGIAMIQHELEIATQSNMLYIPVAAVLTAAEFDGRFSTDPAIGKAPGVKILNQLPIATEEV